MAEEIYEMLDEYFQENVEKIQNSNKNLNNEQLLELYGLYKQSIIGNNNTNNDFKTLKDKKCGKVGINSMVSKKIALNKHSYKKYTNF